MLELLKDGRPRTRSDIALELGIARSTLNSRLDALSATRLVVPGREAASSGGRPPSTVVFNPGARLSLAVHISPTQVRMALIDLGGTIRLLRSLEVGPEQLPQETLAAVLTSGSEMMASIERGSEELAGIGIGLSAIIDGTGKPLRSRQLPAWAGFDITGFIAESMAVPVVVESDVNLHAVHERMARWPGHANLLYVHLGCCPSAAIFSGGQLQRGSTGAAGILAPSESEGDILCRCGSPTLVLTTGTPDAASAREAGRRLGRALAGAVTLLNPSVIVVGGQPREPGYLLAGIRESIFGQCAPMATSSLTISLADGGEDALFRGLSCLLTHRVLAKEAVGSLL
ncbi:ROK family protein [Arthrobacter sp. NPDC057009]|uniref:ROK family transcriptional regulator n=1 Tax=Arthrobacter sp. NPDC057009 TaxID=3345996 RepID=UPI003626F69B